MNLLKNPFIRIAGVIAILYIGLFSNTHKKDSLGNRLSKEQLQKDFGEIKEKSVNIVTTVKMAKAYQQGQIEAKSGNKPAANYIVKDIAIGKGDGAKCEDFVTIQYKSFSNNEPIEKSNKYDLIIGNSSFIPAIQKHIIGMKKGGVRLIILTNSNQALNYEVTMREIKKSATSNPEKCNFNLNEQK